VPEEPNDATPFLPERRSLRALREAAAQCRGCHLWRGATQTVFGEGLKRARLMLVGEQPGDREDRAGRPFVGPGSRELDRALAAAGIERREAYLTNVVKHFKFEERGGRRIHQTPKRFEVEACRPWLDEELRVVRPEALVLLGATASKALFGSAFRVTSHRGELLDSELAPIVAATAHPSSILRGPPEDREANREALVADLLVVARALDESGGGRQSHS
jgi:uracil-DNA glycosylase